MFDSFYAELTCPNCGCQAVAEAQTKDFENALLAFTVGQAVESLTQAELHGLAGCRWCDATIEVPVYVREGRFVGFGEASLQAPQRIPLPPPPLKNPVRSGKIADVVRAVQAQYRGEFYLGWDCGRYSVAVWHQGQWLCASLWGTVDDTLRSLAATDAEGATQLRVQRLEDTLIQRVGGDPRKRLPGWGRREIDRSYLQEVESRVLAVLQGLGITFGDVTLTAQGKLCLTADGTSAESVFYEEVVDTVSNLLRDWVRAKVGIGQKVRLFHDARAAHKTLERLEGALGLAAGSAQAASESDV
jgi:hypothetical protein